MKFIAQYLQAEKRNKRTLQLVLVPEDGTEKALLGAAHMIGVDGTTTEEDGSLSINFVED